ncbi:Pre-mRNA-processing ATP-dependent RNA helicase PRP5 [Durusdinium trenchii]|uniref:Pre-mRNA-processing ATP-dependent RNA helicase PRP5 n=1 Tax=Durusdinium trenchii TaxID=1381693 RepID=A0ABP0JDP4_9DINO
MKGAVPPWPPWPQDTTAPPLQKLTELPLPNWLAEASSAQKGGAIRWEQLDEAATASAIQAQLLPIVLAGENAILVSEAKSGAEAFVYLMLASLQVSDQDPLTEEEPGPIALVLADTQETPAPVRDAAVIFWEAPNRPASGARRLKSPGEQS